MPWKELSEMDQRMEFVVRAKAPRANVAEICREFGISRKTGYKFLSRYEKEGVEGLLSQSRRPQSCPHALSGEMVCEIVELRTKHPRWGGKKLKELLARRYNEESVPSVRSIERVLERCELVKKRREGLRQYLPDGDVIKPTGPNMVWTMDFKGQWVMRNGKRCYPLTIRDDYSKYILGIAALPGTGFGYTKERVLECFERYGLPQYIRSDNGAPFASMNAVAGLSRLSAWFIKNGVTPNRIPPGRPCYNGGHERMHRDMMEELQESPSRNLKEEQSRFDSWREEFNKVRPHQALQMRCPVEVYRRSNRRYNHKEPEFEYSSELETRIVGCRGFLWWKGQPRFLSGALVGERVGLRLEKGTSLGVWYCNFLLGYTDENFTSPLGGR